MAMITIRRLAADVLGVGENRVRIDPKQTKRASEALTRDDVRQLVQDGVVWKVPAVGVARGQARLRAAKKRVGRRRGHGSRRGSWKTRTDAKSAWMSQVRAQRAKLVKLRADDAIETDAYRRVYRMVKGRAFKGVAALESYLKENKLIQKGG